MTVLRRAAARLRGDLAAVNRFLGARQPERRRQADKRVFTFMMILAVANGAAFYRVEDTRRDGDARERSQIARSATQLDAARVREDDRLRAATRRNCRRIHNVVVTLEGIIVDSRGSLRQYHADGTITRKQLRRGLRDNEDARLRLIGADCPPRVPMP